VAVLSQIIVNNGRMMTGLAERMLAGVKPEQFARSPRIGGEVVNANHPAFNYGHLSLYPARLLEMAGLDPAEAKTPDGYMDLFKNGVECRDDPEGTIYPSMEEIVSVFRKSHEAALHAYESLPDDKLNRPNPMGGRMTEMLPTVAHAATFLLGPHLAMHLGQVSTWRRCMGLGPAM